MSHLRMLLVVAVAGVGLVLPGAVGARTAATPLVATVGTAAAPDAFQISLADATGARVTHLDPGAYTITVRDYSTIHNFALSGPGGVSQRTNLDAAETAVWEVTFSNGTYNYVCQAHPGSMKGSFTVGTVTTPPPKPKVKKLSARVTGKSIALRSASGAAVKTLKAGKYRIAVNDSTAADNFHLLGTGVNKKTGVKFKGSLTWSVTLRKGKLSYRSDAHPKLRGTARVT